MDFSVSAARAGGSLRPSIRFHGDSAIEVRSLCDTDARGADVAAHDRRLTDLDALAGDHVALDLSVDVDARGVHRSDDLALGTDDHALLVVNRALDAAFDLDVFLGLELALEAQRRAEYRHAFVRCVHEYSRAVRREARHRLRRLPKVKTCRDSQAWAIAGRVSAICNVGDVPGKREERLRTADASC